jgi:hypothetical protein
MKTKTKYVAIALLIGVTLAIGMITGGCDGKRAELVAQATALEKEIDEFLQRQKVERLPTTVAVFGAGFCGACKHSFPELAKKLATLSDDAQSVLWMRVYVTAGDPSSVKPTPAIADAYAARYFPGAAGIPDPGAATLKTMLPGAKAIPCGAILDEGGQVVKRWFANQFSPEDVYQYVKTRVGE